MRLRRDSLSLEKWALRAFLLLEETSVENFMAEKGAQQAACGGGGGAPPPPPREIHQLPLALAAPSSNKRWAPCAPPHRWEPPPYAATQVGATLPVRAATMEAEPSLEELREAAKKLVGRRLCVTLRAVAGVAAEPLTADLIAVDSTFSLAVFRNAMPTTFMKADYHFLPLARISAWKILGEGEKFAVAGSVSEAVLKQRYEASRKREEELIECRSELASEPEQRFFMELRKSCVEPRHTPPLLAAPSPQRPPCAPLPSLNISLPFSAPHLGHA